MSLIWRQEWCDQSHHFSTENFVLLFIYNSEHEPKSTRLLLRNVSPVYRTDGPCKHRSIPSLPTLSGENVSGESDEFFEKWQKFRPTNNFARQSFANQCNHNLSKWLKSLVGSLVLHFKTLLLLLGKTFRRAKVTNFSFSDENFARRIVSPDESFARQSFAR